MVEVMGNTMTSPAGPLLRLSSETTATGRFPACS
jgi:hypothetical protein